MLLFADKPRITIPVPVVRTVPGHVLWCSAEGTPPINMSLLRNSTPFANGTGIVAGQVYKEGNYTCVASNEAASDSRDFSVTFIGMSAYIQCLIWALFINLRNNKQTQTPTVRGTRVVDTATIFRNVFKFGT